MKKTPWFPFHLKPAHVGVYEREETTWTDPYSYWNGREWRESWSTPEKAFAKRGRSKSIRQDLAWRGLAKKP